MGYPMQENFEAALGLVLQHEGGFVNHPKDPGGATNKGITQRVYNGYQRRKGRSPLQSVRFISDDEVRAIYHQQYWNVVHADELPHGVDYCTFDAAVNSGPSRAGKWLQRAILANPDGTVGNETLGKVKTVPAYSIILRMCEDRMGFLQRLGNWKTFGRGWTSRVNGVRKTSLEWAKREAGTDIVEIDETDTVPRDRRPVIAAVGALIAALAAYWGLDPEAVNGILESVANLFGGA